MMKSKSTVATAAMLAARFACARRRGSDPADAACRPGGRRPQTSRPAASIGMADDGGWGGLDRQAGRDPGLETTTMSAAFVKPRSLSVAAARLEE